MAKKRIIWQIYPPFLAVTLLALAAMAVYANQVYQTLFLDQVRNDLERNAILLKERFKPYLELGDNSAVDGLCKKASQEGKIRVTMIDASGLVLGDSERNPKKMDNHADRAEFIEALGGKIGSSERFSETIQRNMMYVAIPIRLNPDNAIITHALRTSISTQILYQEQRNFYLKLILPAILISILAATISWYLSRRFTKPLIEMTSGANRFAQGNFDTPLESPDSVEISSLATALNEMAKQLNTRMVAMLEQRKELETILTSMSEGIIAIDCDSKLVNINKAAKNLLNIHSKNVLSRTLVEVTRNPELIDLAEKTLEKRQRQEKTIDLSSTEDRILLASSNPVFNIEGHLTGVVLVLSDVTKQAKLETMRKDFVANVSHELKTPITSIKGYVETLIETRNIDEETRERFLQIVVKQTDRLHNIIEDLLKLSRLDDENAEISMDTVNLNHVLESAIEACTRKFEENKTSIHFDAPQIVFANANAALLEQAVINLLENAIKYSPEGSEVHLELSKDGGSASIQVSDNGSGIAEKYHGRIFERFYRIDKARSQASGSTGLGLAIVKHIVNLHGGEITLQSAEGQGSVFSIKLPSEDSEIAEND